MAKPADLRAAMSGRRLAPKETSPPPEPLEPETGVRFRHYRPGREGKSNVTGYFDPIVKRQLRVLAAERDTTIQALLGEALNDLFAKHGKPEVVSVDAVKDMFQKHGKPGIA